MLISAALVAGVTASAGLLGPIGLPAGVEIPACTKSEALQKIVVDGLVKFRCVQQTATGDASKEFKAFIANNRFSRGAQSHSFCKGNRYMLNGRRGTYKVTGARYKRLPDGRTTLTATIRLNLAGKRLGVRGELAVKGLKMNGRKYRFAGPAASSC
jgi:hypothetical protein